MHNARVDIKQELQVLIFCKLGADYSELAFSLNNCSQESSPFVFKKDDMFVRLRWGY
jgi:hypothetical protein